MISPIRRSQVAMHTALMEVAKVAAKDSKTNDGVMFIVLMTEALAAITVEMIPSKALHEPDAPERMTKFATDQLAKFMRDAFADRLKHERAKGLRQ